MLSKLVNLEAGGRSPGRGGELEVSSDNAEVVKVVLRKYESTQIPKQRVIITSNSFMQKKSCPRYLQGEQVSGKLHETMYMWS